MASVGMEGSTSTGRQNTAAQGQDQGGPATTKSRAAPLPAHLAWRARSGACRRRRPQQRRRRGGPRRTGCTACASQSCAKVGGVGRREGGVRRQGMRDVLHPGTGVVACEACPPPNLQGPFSIRQATPSPVDQTQHPKQPRAATPSSLEVAAGPAVPVARLGLHVGLGSTAAAAHGATAIVGGRVIPIPSVPLLPGLIGVLPPARRAVPAIRLRPVRARSRPVRARRRPVARCSTVPARRGGCGGRCARWRRHRARWGGATGGCAVLCGGCAARPARPRRPSRCPLRALGSPTPVALCAPREIVIAARAAHPVPCTTDRRPARNRRTRSAHNTRLLVGAAHARTLPAHAGPELMHPDTPLPTQHAHTRCPAHRHQSASTR